MAHLYCVAENTGKGFITADDSRNFYRSGHAGNVWVIENNVYGQAWITRKNATIKTLEQAQTIVDTEIQTAIDAWEADNVEGETAEQKILRIGEKPVKYSLPQE